ncbi:MAG: hypothetical protein K9W42_00045 [Candidatus Heimdallarchaeota archaeon]|nr:hypothetical protein [Candidatus Heimdallarchaeota archaeon]
MGFFEVTLWQNLVSELFATFIGALLGILTALWLERLLQSRRDKIASEKAKKTFQMEKKKVLEFLLIEIEKNGDLLKKIREELNPNSVIYYNLDISSWDSLESKKADLIDNIDLLVKLNQLYYEYQQIIRKIDLYLNSIYSTLTAMTNYPKLRDALVYSIWKHIEIINKTSVNVIELINRELESLNI